MSRHDETLQRVRRIETRLVRVMVKLGIDAETTKPHFDPGSLSTPERITLPSPHTSVKEVLDNIPPSWDGPVGVFVGDRKVATITRC